jgi:hypothetical protein
MDAERVPLRQEGAAGRQAEPSALRGPLANDKRNRPPFVAPQQTKAHPPPFADLSKSKTSRRRLKKTSKQVLPLYKNSF